MRDKQKNDNKSILGYFSDYSNIISIALYKRLYSFVQKNIMFCTKECDFCTEYQIPD